MEAETVAAAQGLLAGGADEVVVLDNHGSGNPMNVSAECLPPGARLEQWDEFDLPMHGIDAMFQVGYHARGGTAGFISHTYVPGLRLRVGEEAISESHGRAWAAGVPLIGIVGNDTHQQTLGSLSETPYLVVQRTVAGDLAEPVFTAEEGGEAIRAFARQAVAHVGEIPPARAPTEVVLAASLANGDGHADAMLAAGWRRTGSVEFEADLAGWSQARRLIVAGMSAAFAPLLPFFDGATSAEEAAALDADRVETVATIIDEWCSRTHPAWYTEPANELAA
jgi:D-aminopeptidase